MPWPRATLHMCGVRPLAGATGVCSRAQVYDRLVFSAEASASLNEVDVLPDCRQVIPWRGVSGKCFGIFGASMSFIIYWDIPVSGYANRG
jgi:hypothetical protein